MSTRFPDTERYDPTRHDPPRFSCGNELLDRWLTRYAGQNERRDAARTFLAAKPDGTILGYYTVLAGQLQHYEATAQVGRGLSRHFPISVAILARLAVDTRHQGRGLGAALLHDALVRICRASEQIAVRAVVVHAIDNDAASFYQRFGFQALAAAPRTLMVTIAALHEAGYL